MEIKSIFCIVLFFQIFVVSTEIQLSSEFSVHNSTTTGYGSTSDMFNTTTSGGGTTSGGISTSCSTNVDCSTCTDSIKCIWCESTFTCNDGHWYGDPSCGNWKWKQCSVSGKILMITCGSVVGFFILCCIICICCCCCRRSRNKVTKLKDFKEFKSLQLQEEQEGLISKHPNTDQTRAKLMKKYGSKLSGSSRSSDV